MSLIKSKLLFDSNCHPTVKSTWLNKKNNNSFSELQKSVIKNNLSGALAVGIDSIDSFNRIQFINECKKYHSLVPIAGFSPHKGEIECNLEDIFNLGYRGIKIHPRFSKFNLVDGKEDLIRTINICDNLGLVVLLCTYFLDQDGKMILENPISYLNEVLKKTDDPKLILMHSGYLDYKNFFKKIISKTNLLFDFSYTIMQPELIDDKKTIKSVINNYYERICIGSDWPEFTHYQLIDRLIDLLKGISDDKIKKIMNYNIRKFFDL
tara:strand:+ start:888 stop:1682 length:795 start_codon:yes stop_codon:yes gene_type:complete